MSSQPRALREVVGPSPMEELVVAVSKWRPTRKQVGGIALWVLGVYLCYFAAAPYSPSAAQLAKYSAKMELVADQDVLLGSIESELIQARAELHRVKVFMWNWRMPYKELVPPRQQRYNAVRAQYRRAEREMQRLARAAKSELGIWSDYGIAETRETFWSYFRAGKRYAQRQTFWDALFSIGERDEHLAGFVLKWVFRILINVTIGLVGSTIGFFFSLWGVIASFQPNVLSAAAFYAVAMFAAVSMVGAILAGLYATTVGGVVLAAKQVHYQQRLQHYRAQARPQRYLRHHRHAD